MIVNLIVNECQFEKYLLFGLKERHVAGNPEQNDLRRVTAFFLWVNIGLMKKIGGGCKKVWEVFAKSEGM